MYIVPRIEPLNYLKIINYNKKTKLIKKKKLKKKIELSVFCILCIIILNPQHKAERS